MSSQPAKPTLDKVAAALSEVNWIYLDEGYDGGMFHIELQGLQGNLRIFPKPSVDQHSQR